MGGFFSEIIGRILGRVVVTGMFVGGAHHMATGGAGMGMVQSALGKQPSAAHAGTTPASTAGLGALLGSTQRAATPEFFELKARVTAVERECRLMNHDGGTLTRTEVLPCERAKRLLQRTDFSSHTLSDQTRITYIYYAPDGNAVHEGSARRSSKDSAFLTVGDVLEIKVDSRHPTKSNII